MTEIIDYKTGKFFPTSFVFGGYVFVVLGILFEILGIYFLVYQGLDMAIVTILLGGIIIICAGIFSFSFTGINIDLTNRKYRKHFGYLGLRIGKWKNLGDFPYICVLRSVEGYRGYDGGIPVISEQEEFYNISLLNSSHKEKLVLYQRGEKEKSLKEAKELADKLGLKFVAYAPVISAKTKARRM